jgi:hypothetical protein
MLVTVDADDVIDRGDEYGDLAVTLTGRERVLLQHALLFISEHDWSIIGDAANIEATKNLVLTLQGDITS